MSKFAILFILFFFSGALSALFRSEVAFALYQTVYFINPENRWWAGDIPSIPYSYITVLLMAFLLVKNYKQLSMESPWLQQNIFLWMGALLALYHVTTLYALVPDAHMLHTTNFTKLLIIISIAYKLIRNEKALDLSIWAYLLGCTYIGYIATITGRNSGDRVEGIGMVDGLEANDTAAALVPAAVLLMYFAWQGNNKIRFVAVIMGALIANGLILINSRGAFVGVAVSLGFFLVFMIFSKFQEKGQKITAIFMIVLGLSGAFVLTDESFWERMSTLQNTEDKKASGSGRIVFWLATFDMLEEHPFGMGVKGYNILAPTFIDKEARGSVLNRSVHSLWFQGLSEVGWLGLVIFMVILVSLIKQSRQAKRHALSNKDYKIYFKLLALECALLGFLISGSFINRFRAEILYWMILLLMLAIKVYYQNSKKLGVKSFSCDD
jgi:hypothetical protein